MAKVTSKQIVSAAPSGTAAGDLSGTYPNPKVAKLTETAGPTDLTIGAVADTQMLVRSGTALVGAAVPTALPPSGSAGGDLGSTYPNPTVTAIHETSGPTKLTAGAIADGNVLRRVGSTLVSIAVQTGTWENKGMAAEATTADFNEACATGITETPAVTTNAQGSYVEVRINGVGAIVGDGVKTKDCYFSGNGGTTARGKGAIVATDKLYWVGSVAGYQLAATDKVDFLYTVA